MHKFWEIIYFHRLKPLVLQQCIKTCINDKFHVFSKPYVPRGLQKQYFPKWTLCKPKMNTLYTIMQKRSL